MIYALGYSLEPVRTVLSNEINDIYIYRQIDGSNNAFYTCISIKNQEIKKKVLMYLADYQDINKNIDYKGNFVHENTLNLLFEYHIEKKLSTYIGVYTTNFAQKCQTAKNLVRACHISNFPLEWICLLLHARNINIDEAQNIYFNYFIDFRELDTVRGKKIEVYRELAEMVFDILTQDYKYIRKIKKYPKELRLFYKKMTVDQFHSYGEFYKFLNMLPEKLEPEHTVMYDLKRFFGKIIRITKKYITTLILIFIIGLTIFYTVVQIKTRQAQKNLNDEIKKEAGVYKELYSIGTVEIEQDK